VTRWQVGIIGIDTIDIAGGKTRYYILQKFSLFRKLLHTCIVFSSI